jgi:hypothetical protein
MNFIEKSLFSIVNLGPSFFDILSELENFGFMVIDSQTEFADGG